MNKETPLGILSATPQKSPLRIGVSACVVGQDVRYSGGHKLSRFVRDDLGPHVEFVPVCPEVEMGLTVPRESMRLVRLNNKTRLIAPKSGTDHTEAMQAFAEKRTKQLEALNLCGFIGQKGSPSCGMERVKAYPPKKGGMPTRDERGIFTRELMRRFPRLPVEEDGRLNDLPIREHFIVRILAFRRMRDLLESDWKASDLVAFHSREKLLILAHGDYRPLGRLVANRGDLTLEEWGQRYQEMFLDTLAKPPSTGRHINVMQHAVGYFRPGLDSVSRAEVADLITAYGNNLVPLVVPLTLVRHHVRSLGLQYLHMQSYLNANTRRLVPPQFLAAS